MMLSGAGHRPHIPFFYLLFRACHRIAPEGQNPSLIFCTVVHRAQGWPCSEISSNNADRKSPFHEQLAVAHGETRRTSAVDKISSEPGDLPCPTVAQCASLAAGFTAEHMAA